MKYYGSSNWKVAVWNVNLSFYEYQWLDVCFQKCFIFIHSDSSNECTHLNAVIRYWSYWTSIPGITVLENLMNKIIKMNAKYDVLLNGMWVYFHLYIAICIYVYRQ